MAIHIVTDSTACLPQGYAEEHGVTVIPLKVSVDGEYFRDGIDITNDEFYRRLVAGAKAGAARSRRPRSSPPPIVPFWTRIPKGTSSRFTSVHACRGPSTPLLPGATQLDTTHVQFVDTLNAALGVGFPAMRAVELAEAGVPLAQVIAEVEALVQRTHTYFVLDSLTYLERGGRIGNAAAIAASILKIKPVLTYIDGVTDVMDRPRTKKVALERLWAIIDKHMQKGVEYVGFHYGANRTEVEGFQREFTSRYNVPSILTQLGPVVGTYSGPDMIGIVIVEKKSQ